MPHARPCPNAQAARFQRPHLLRYRHSNRLRGPLLRAGPSLSRSRMRSIPSTLVAAFLILPCAFSQSEHKQVLTGQNAFTDAAHESPGTRRHLTVADLPAPKPDESVDNGADMVPRPANAWPQAPKGFKVELYTTNLDNPRLLRTAPNGDIFL